MRGYSRPLAVALLSAGTLSYEILLVRAFGIEHFHHFAYMAIGVAMLGFGASGTLLALVRPGPSTGERSFVVSALATPLALLASAALVHLIPLDASQLPWSLPPWLKLALIYLVLALPFAVGAAAVLLALMLEKERAGRIYGASFVGAGLGATLALSILWVVTPERALAVPALAAAAGAVSVAVARRRTGVAVAAVAGTALAAASLAWPPWQLRINPYKALPQVEAYPEARRVAERVNPVGWVVAVEAPAFHHAPGLSLGYRGEFPPQTALFVDGDIVGAMTDWRRPVDRRLLDWLPTAAGYVASRIESALIVGAGGGTEVWNALEHGARRVRAVELHAGITELARASMSRAGSVEADLRWVVGDGRRYVSSTDERFDLVTLGPGRGFGTSAAGVHALNEDFLHTVEAYRDYLEGLTPDGLLAINGWVTVPPRENLRAILTAAEALRRVAPGRTAGALVVMRSWSTVTVLAKPSGFEPSQIGDLVDWAEARGFDLDWYPGIEGPGGPEFNRLDDPVFFRAAAAAVAGAEAADAFVADYPFDVGPVDDGRPYPHHFLRAGSLAAFLSRDRGSLLPIAEWGYMALIATLAQSLVLAAVLLLLPVAAAGRWAARQRSGRVVAYFSAIGLGFMAAEIAAIQQLTLLLGHPVYAVAAVLVVLLACSGVGSMRSDRWPEARGWAIALTLTALTAVCAAALLPLSRALQPAALPARVAVTAAVLAPLAFLMGTMFPLGLRAVAEGEEEKVAWAWAANGFASVVATPLAALIALEAGSRALWLAAAAAYAAAALSYRASARAVLTARSRAPG